MEEDLKGNEPQVEGAESTPSEEKKPTQLEEKQSTLRYSQEEFQKALDKAVGKGLSSLNQQLSASKIEEKRLEKLVNASDAEIKRLDKVNRDLLNDPEAVGRYQEEGVIAKQRYEAAKEKAEAERLLTEARKEKEYAQLAKGAREISKEFGIPFADLEECTTMGEMRLKAKEHQIDKKLAELEGTSETFKPDPGISTGGGWRNLSPDEKLRQATKNM